MIIKFLIKGSVIFLLTAPFLFAQPEIPPGAEWFKLKSQNEFNLSGNISPDSSVITEKKQVKAKKFRMKKSPTAAVLLSAVLPGAGQFYNESYWKIPVIGGLVGYFGYEYFRNNNQYKDYRSLYEESQTPENSTGNLNYKSLREFYRDQRDDFVWYFLIVYVINMVDAYVDAHLFDFDVKEEKISQFQVPGKTYRLSLNVKF